MFNNTDTNIDIIDYYREFVSKKAGETILDGIVAVKIGREWLRNRVAAGLEIYPYSTLLQHVFC